MAKGQGKLEDRIKDRYNGVNDPLAQKISGKMKEFKIPEAPADKNITTLFVGGIDEETDVSVLESHFTGYGKLHDNSTKMIVDKKCAFVSFIDRLAAEKCFSTLYERLFYNGSK